MRTTAFLFLLQLSLISSAFSQNTTVVRPREIKDVLVNPGMGITTFQRFNRQAIYPDLRWSEVGPEKAEPDSPSPVNFPGTSVAYLRWFWYQLEPEQGRYNWDIIDGALEQARSHGQQLQLRVMPYDQKSPLPEWYRKSGARRANRDTDQDGQIWSPDSDDPLYFKHWTALVSELGRRYDGHPYLDSVDVSTVGYWGEGWGPYLPAWSVQKALIDVYLDAFKRTPLLMNFDEIPALAYGIERGAGWRLDCWGDMGRPGKNFIHMLDSYPQGVVRARAQDAWKRSPVSLETCGTPGSWHKLGFDLEYIFEQALRWHASTINIKSTAIPPEWQAKYDEFQKKIGYRFILRRLEYPNSVRSGRMAAISMWWLNAGVAPIYRDFVLALQLGPQVINTGARLREWLPGDAVVEESIYIPEGIKPGKYPVRVAVLDPHTGHPAVKLAIDGRESDGWYRVGEIEVK
ncbi:MAG: DUF4832 domain-containing protein [Acidobacteria bacterium]|nr:MAG: DUF4832 domain-containing protein [Acidobacteriota bacterium]